MPPGRADLLLILDSSEDLPLVTPFFKASLSWKPWGLISSVRGSLPWRPAWSSAPQTAGLLQAICSCSLLCRSILLSRLAGGTWLMVPGLCPACGCLSYHCPCRGLHHVTPHQPPGSELQSGLEPGFVLQPLRPLTSSPPSGHPPALFPRLHSCDPLPRPCPPSLPPAEPWYLHKASPLPFPQEPALLPLWPRG